MNVLSISKKNFIVISALAVVFCISSCRKNDNKIIYFIPKGYKGWVNIIYTDTAKSVQPFRFNNGYVYMITGDPSDFKIAYDKSFGDWYEIDYYYYDKNSIIEINNKIHFDETIGSPGNSGGPKHTVDAYSFFISDSTEFNKDPENPIFERYK